MYFKNNIFIVFLIFLFTNLISCGGESSDKQSTDPANLILEVVVSEDGSGNIEVIASAENTIEYYFDLGETNVEPITNTTGLLAYQYESSGTYLISVRAIGVSGRYISKTKEITIQVGTVVDNTIDISKGYITPEVYSGFDLVWNDEFDGTSLSSDWTHEIGTGSNGWGNNELQYYRSQNTTVKDDVLIIMAKEESFSGRQYTSSRIITQGNQSFKYGRIDIRALLPEGQGIWPALWMLGSSFSTVGWPKCGEIDIMEMIGGSGRENNVFGTLHWDNAGENACTCGQGSGYTLSSGTFNDEFHVFSLIWDAQKIEWYVDDQKYKTIDITPADLSEFQNEFFFIFNVAVGGNLPGSPNGTTQFPQQMVVDYVRVFQKQ